MVVGGLLYLGVYLTLAPILGSVEKQDIMNLRTLLGGARGFGVTKRKPVRYGEFARRRSSQRKLKTEYCISLQDRNGRLHLIARVKRG